MSTSHDSHLTLDLLLRALRGELPLSAVLARAHDHLLGSCSTCREEWETGDGGGLPTLAEDFADEKATSGADVERSIERLAIKRKLYREAEEDVQSLLTLSTEEWIPKVARSRSRHRSRAFAQRLIEEGRGRVRDAPEIAALLAAVVPVSLQWATKLGRPWALALVALAEAHRANALRVKGDLAASAVIFARLSGELEEAPWGFPATRGEIASLHASLLVEQGSYAQADTLLECADSWFEEAVDEQGRVRALIARANLAGTLGDPSLAFHLHTEAAGRLVADDSPSLYLGTVTGRVLALGELRQIEAGRALLRRYRKLYEDHGGEYGRAHVSCLRGRLELEEGAFEAAAQRFQEGRDGLLSLGRSHDAAMASLDLAMAQSWGGQEREAQALLVELVTTFADLGASKQLLASLRLLAEGEARSSTKESLYRQVRQQLLVEALRRGF